jgi:hypothetical protein
MSDSNLEPQVDFVSFALVSVDLLVFDAAFWRTVRCHSTLKAEEGPDVDETAMLAVAVEVFFHSVVVDRNEGKRSFAEDFLALLD